MTTTIQRTICVFVALLGASGCSFNPIGESTFDCNRKENPSPFCRSFKSLEKSTTGALPESRFDKEFKMSDYDQATGIAPLSTGSTINEPSVPTTSKEASVLPHNRASVSRGTELIAGAPVRRAPVIQRVYIKKFVDENDMLQGDIVVYKEVKASKWSGFDSANAVNNFAGGVAYPHKVKEGLSLSLNQESVTNLTNKRFNQSDANAEVLGAATAISPAVSGDK